MPAFVVPEQTNKAVGVRRATTVDPLGIASILLFEGEVTVGIEIHRGDVGTQAVSEMT